jgi:hypothetical protein
MGVSFMTQPLVDCDQGASKSFLRGFTLQSSFPVPALSPVVGQAKEVKGGETFPVLECLPCLALAKS